MFVCFDFVTTLEDLYETLFCMCWQRSHRREGKVTIVPERKICVRYGATAALQQDKQTNDRNILKIYIHNNEKHWKT